MELSYTENYHANRHNGYRYYGKSSEFTLKGFAFVLLVCEERFLLTVERAYSFRVARLKHYYNDNENCAKNRNYYARNANNHFQRPVIHQ